jgi:GGDEF domain-containing protein
MTPCTNQLSAYLSLTVNVVPAGTPTVPSSSSCCQGPAPRTSDKSAIASAARVAETSVEDGDPPVGVTVSLGGATFRESSDSTDSLVALADGALYEAKEGGRNRLVVAY